MLKNFIVLAWRNLIKHKTLGIINIAGLSLSLCLCVLLVFHIRKEYSYDGFHAAKGRLFRMEMSSLWSSGEVQGRESWLTRMAKEDNAGLGDIFPLIVGRDMQTSFPEIRHTVRFQDAGDQFLRSPAKTIKVSHFLYADSSFFLSLSFPLLKGNIVKAFADRSSVVLSESLSKKMFGSADPIGQQVMLLSDSSHPFIVRGIASDAPGNSSIQFEAVVPITADADYQTNIDEGFNHMSHFLLVELNENVSVPAFQQKIEAWAKPYSTPFLKKFYNDQNLANYHWNLRPLELCHFAAAPWGHFTDRKNIYQLGCLVLIILLIAALNYVLLSVSRATARSQEVGVRKVMGARKRNVIYQFWIETQLLVFIAVVFALGLALLVMPLFNSLMGTHIRVSDFHFTEIVFAAIAISLALGLLAGYYPAWLLSRMPAVSVLKSFRTFKINPRFSTVLVVLQYTACVILMIAAVVVNRQMNFISQRNLGFDKDQILMVENPVYDDDFTRRVKNELFHFAATQPYVIACSGMNGSLDGSYNNNGFKLNGEQRWRKQFTVDYGFFEMLKLPFAKGRGFSNLFPSDTSSEVRAAVVNETLFKMLGPSAKLGQFNEPLGERIVGVVKDFNFESLSRKIEPADVRLAHGGYVSHFLFKLQAGHVSEAIEKLRAEWKKVTADYPFEYTFMDQNIAKMYEADRRWLTIIRFTCFFAVFIAYLGLFGLSSINAVNRVREIGIRKILGARIIDIVGSLSLKFLLWVGIAVIIAIPIAWISLNQYLEDFAYRIRIDWWLPVMVGAIAMIIAFFTVSIQSFRAANANPVKSLRSD